MEVPLVMTSTHAAAHVEPVAAREEPASIIRRPRPSRPKKDRRTDILQTLARLLENPACDRITTAMIARELDLSEAALYRSFRSKGAMYDALIEFVETSILTLFSQIREDQNLQPVQRIQLMITVLLDFADANPGLTRVMTGQVLLKEEPKLMERMMRLIDTIETQLRQAYREAAMEGALPADFNTSGSANLVVNWVIGRWSRFANTNFRVRPNGVSAVAMRPFFMH